jgi:hypothetical protein
MLNETQTTVQSVRNLNYLMILKLPKFQPFLETIRGDRLYHLSRDQQILNEFSNQINTSVITAFLVFFSTLILQFMFDCSHITVFSTVQISQTCLLYLSCFNIYFQWQISISYTFIFVVDSNTWPTVPKECFDYKIIFT